MTIAEECKAIVQKVCSEDPKYGGKLIANVIDQPDEERLILMLGRQPGLVPDDLRNDKTGASCYYDNIAYRHVKWMIRDHKKMPLDSVLISFCDRAWHQFDKDDGIDENEGLIEEMQELIDDICEKEGGKLLTCKIVDKPVGYRNVPHTCFVWTRNEIERESCWPTILFTLARRRKNKLRYRLLRYVEWEIGKRKFGE